MKLQHLITLALACLLEVNATGGAIAQGDLTGTEIRDIAPCKFTGRYYHSDPNILPGEQIAGQMTAAGTFFMKWNGGAWPNGRFDKARWWVEGTTWCRQFVVFAGATPACYSVRREGPEFGFYDAGGQRAFVITCNAFTS